LGYPLLTFRRVFGLRWPATVIRSAVTGVVYLFIFVATELVLIAATLSTL